MRKYLSLICLLAIWISGCNQENVLKNQSTSAEGRVFTTSLESDGSRTYLEEGRLSRWTEGDLISLFDGNTLNRKYQFDGKTGDNSGTFSIVNKPFGTGAILSANYAVYPYASDMKISEKGVITTTLPAVQSYANNSFGLGDNTMVAVTKDTYDTFLHFKNVGGCIKLQLYGDDITVKSITLTGNNHEKLAGKASIMAAYNDVPTVLMTNNATESITLDCGEGVKIGNTAETATEFWMVVPPTTFEKGITVKMTDVDNNAFTQTTANKLEIKRNVIKQMAAFEVDIPYPYLTFTAKEHQTLRMTKAVETVEYSVNNGEWTTLGTKNISFGGELGTLQLRGNNLYGTSGSTIKFGNTTSVSCKGDIRTLLNYKKYNTVDTSNAKFTGLFSNCTSLVTAPSLPATKLAELCYATMFSGCTSLVSAPELPALTLSKQCYDSMFFGCSALTSAPTLLATTLATMCYIDMFHGCRNLVDVQIILPAKTMAYWCYTGMFYACYSLNTAPKLPATTLAEGCYMQMFEECTNLVTAPTLPATTLTKDCYLQMFLGCKKLSSLTMLATNASASNCLSNWVKNVASTGTFTKAKAMKSLPNGINGIPSGWTVVSK